jgi:hypothetical protein
VHPRKLIGNEHGAGLKGQSQEIDNVSAVYYINSIQNYKQNNRPDVIKYEDKDGRF